MGLRLGDRDGLAVIAELEDVGVASDAEPAAKAGVGIDFDFDHFNVSFISY